MSRNLLAVNPVLAREARVRMRTWRAPALISLYAGLLGLVVIGILFINARVDGSVFSPGLGGAIYAFLVFAQGALLVFAAPGLTAGAISGERERQTLDLLLITHLSSLQVVIGKLGAALSFAVLLMLASLPVYGVLFLFGGVSLVRLGYTVIVYLATVLLLGAIGIFFSALFKRTQAAVVAAYGTSFGWIIGSMILGVLTQEILWSRVPNGLPPRWTLITAYANPMIGLAAAAGGPANNLTGLFRRLLSTPGQEAIWWKYVLFCLAVVVVLTWATARKIHPMKNK